MIYDASILTRLPHLGISPQPGSVVKPSCGVRGLEKLNSSAYLTDLGTWEAARLAAQYTQPQQTNLLLLPHSSAV